MVRPRVFKPIFHLPVSIAAGRTGNGASRNDGRNDGWTTGNALYLGPVFESGTHGYDTADYFRVDRRLGDETTLALFSEALHRRGIRLILDGVFHHLDLVRLELGDRQVVEHLLGAVDDWIGRYGIDAVNAAGRPAVLCLDAPLADGGRLEDRLQAGETVAVRRGRLSMEIPARGARVLISAP